MTPLPVTPEKEEINPLFENDYDDDDDENDEIYFPIEEIVAVETKNKHLETPIPVLRFIPTGAGILQNLQLLGIFPTTRWLMDKTMPADVKEMFGGTPFFALGEYRVAHLVIMDAKQEKHQVTIIVNTGVEGMKTGFWGGTFNRYTFECLAKFEFTGDFETTIKEQKNTNGFGDATFSAFENLDFANGFCDSTHIKCDTQLERILAIAVEFLLSLDWRDILPECLIEVRDKSPQLLRRRRAIERSTPRKTRRKLVFEELEKREIFK